MTPDLLPPRFAARVTVDTNGCWIVLGAHGDHYASVSHCNKRSLAHRLAYEILVGPIPDGLTIDHLCMVKSCCNPEHLEPVSLAENLKRARRAGKGAGAINVAKTHCPKGHPYSGENLYRRADGRRECRTCQRARIRAAYWATKDGAA